MATVNVTRSLVAEVRANIELICKGEETRLAAPLLNGVPVEEALCNEIKRTLWAGYEDLEAKMPAHWKSASSYVTLRVEQPGTAVLLNKQYQSGSYQVFPPGVQWARTFKVDHIYGAPVFDDKTAPAFMAFVTKLLEINQKYEKISEQIQQFLDAHKTLNQALKAYPDLALYIPKEYMDRINKKVERGAAETREIPQIDVSLITSTGVAAKLAEGV
jgi:hypothetical protein